MAMLPTDSVATGLDLVLKKAKKSGVEVHGMIPLTKAQAEEIRLVTGIEARSLTFGSMQIGDVSLIAMPVACW